MAEGEEKFDVAATDAVADEDHVDDSKLVLPDVKLEKVDVKSGEEVEDVMFQMCAAPREGFCGARRVDDRRSGLRVAQAVEAVRFRAGGGVWR